jgi:AraC family transcriptional regulator, regulatory protein of adaptative response / methylated-DNA-[protein]-cysteine methyltransferase
MNTQNFNNYDRVAAAIEYIRTNFRQQPDLREVAGKVNLSPFHFQRIFTEWAGVSPKRFLQYLSLEYAKGILRDQQATIFDAAYETGLSGTGRLHDLFIKIEGMSPGEFKNGGKSLSINYSFAESPFGEIIVASTPKGLCYLGFSENQELAFHELQKNFPLAKYNQTADLNQKNAIFIFTGDWNKLNQIKLHIKGTAFQLKVWEALLKIPMGQLTSYASIAKSIDHPKACRAVGSAVGDNPIAFLIPCHRVIQSTGMLGQYHYGSTRKTAMIGWEAAKVNPQPAEE